MTGKPKPGSDAPRQYPEQILNIGVSSSALFDTRAADRIFREKGETAYRDHMRRHAGKPFGPGPAFGFVKKMLTLNTPERTVVNMTILSHNHPLASRRIDASLLKNGLVYTANGIRQGTGESYTTGGAITPAMLAAHGVDLFLSTDEKDVRAALASGIAAGKVAELSGRYGDCRREITSGSVTVAFDFDRVLAVGLDRKSEAPIIGDSESYFQQHGLEKYRVHERQLSAFPAAPGPLAAVFEKMVRLRDFVRSFPGSSPERNVRIAIVTARAGDALPRVSTTFAAWNIEPDELISSGATPKAGHIRALGADVLFDDGERHIRGASAITTAVWVPWTEFVARTPIRAAWDSGKALRLAS